MALVQVNGVWTDSGCQDAHRKATAAYNQRIDLQSRLKHTIPLMHNAADRTAEAKRLQLRIDQLKRTEITYRALSRPENRQPRQRAMILPPTIAGVYGAR